MAAIGQLSALKVSRLNSPGFYCDGGGLYLAVGVGGAKSWIFRFMLKARSRAMGLGRFRDVSLVEARLRAAECRRLLSQGIDPLDARRTNEKAKVDAAARAVTFEQCALAYIDAHRPSWKNTMSAKQWESSLKTDAFDIIGALPVHEVDTPLVLRILKPIWTRKTESASRLRGRIEAILDWAKVQGYRSGENPAQWRGHIEHSLPKPSKVHKVKHHNALPFVELPAFMAQLRNQPGMAAKALEFIILTAARRREALEARWNEIDFKNASWTVPESQHEDWQGTSRPGVTTRFGASETIV